MTVKFARIHEKKKVALRASVPGLATDRLALFGTVLGTGSSGLGIEVRNERYLVVNELQGSHMLRKLGLRKEMVGIAAAVASLGRPCRWCCVRGHSRLVERK